METAPGEGAGAVKLQNEKEKTVIAFRGSIRAGIKSKRHSENSVPL
jgi:hypothetical protein